MIARDGREAWGLDRGQALWDERGVATRMVGSHTEVAGPRQTEEQLRRHVASRDLQEPIRTVSSFTGLLHHKYGAQFDATGRRYLDLILPGSARMKTLVDDLLTFSRRFGERREPRPASPGGQLGHGPLPTVLSDAQQLAQLLQNLIGTAQVQTQGRTGPGAPGPVREDHTWHFRVTDNGIGIEPQYLHKVFELFQRLHGRARCEGSRLGLVCLPEDHRNPRRAGLHLPPHPAGGDRAGH